MAHGTKYVAYIRVSTKRQGESGLGLEAQQAACGFFLSAYGGMQVAKFREVESGARDDRPELEKAVNACRLYGATLLVAKMDRLSRDAAYILSFKKRRGVQVQAANAPVADETMTGVDALFSERERKLISERTRAALAAARARGVKLGNPENLTQEAREKGAAAGTAVRQTRADERAGMLADVIAEIQASGATSLRAIAAELTTRRIPTARGGDTWTAAGVSRVLERIPPA